MATTNPGGSAADSGEHKHSFHKVFPASRAGLLDSHLRRFIYRPDHLAGHYVKPGDVVLDFGCGPGFFTRAFAKRVGDTGRVIAVDLQHEMLRLLREKLEPEGLMPRIRTHQCAADSIGLSPGCDGKIDAAFAIFVVHEVPDPARLFREIAALLVLGGHLFYSEPPLEVSGREFWENLALAQRAGLRVAETRLFFVNRAALLRKEKEVRNHDTDN